LERQFAPDDRPEPSRARSHQWVFEGLQVVRKGVARGLREISRRQYALGVHQQRGGHVCDKVEHEKKVKWTLSER